MKHTAQSIDFMVFGCAFGIKQIFKIIYKIEN